MPPRTPDLVHWHGLRTDPLNDGAVEEGSPLIAPGTTLRYHLTPSLSGTRWYHTHAMAMGDLSLSTYTGQFGFLLVDGAPDPGAHDREIEPGDPSLGAAICADGGAQCGRSRRTCRRPQAPMWGMRTPR